LHLITSQFLPRSRGDRPPVVPERSKNLAYIGQFCELPDDVVFTVEYSIRSAQTAVYSLLGLQRIPPRVYKGQHDPRVLLKAFLSCTTRTSRSFDGPIICEQYCTSSHLRWQNTLGKCLDVGWLQ
jgi:oleate hydratase